MIDTETRPVHKPGITTRSLTLGYGQAEVVKNLDLDLPTAKVTSIIGANGCGKSTLLRGMLGLLPSQTGTVSFDGQERGSLNPRQLARRVAFLPQHPVVPEGITVAELVERGRYPHHGFLRRRSARDDDIVARALELTGTADFAGRMVTELSGGQRQRVWLAMVLAQDTEVLLLDEPTSFLDIRHQLDLLMLVRTLNQERGITAVMVLHDLAMAARFSDHLVAMSAGRVVAQGEPSEVVTPEVVREVFGIDSHVMADPETGTPVVLPRTRRR